MAAIRKNGFILVINLTSAVLKKSFKKFPETVLFIKFTKKIFFDSPKGLFFYGGIFIMGTGSLTDASVPEQQSLRLLIIPDSRLGHHHPGAPVD